MTATRKERVYQNAKSCLMYLKRLVRALEAIADNKNTTIYLYTDDDDVTRVTTEPPEKPFPYSTPSKENLIDRCEAQYLSYMTLANRRTGMMRKFSSKYFPDLRALNEMLKMDLQRLGVEVL